MKRILTFIILLLFLYSCSTHVTFGPKDLNMDLVNDPKIRIGVLENGLRYVIRVNDNPEKKAEFRLGVNVGSLHEDEDKQGAAHFIEHMAFNGTDHFSQKELLDFFHDNGMSFGADLNASTSHTKTIYRFSLPTDQKEVIDKGFLILEDWAHGIRFQKEEVDKERNIIIEELRARKSVNKRVRDQVMPLVYGPSYLNRLPIGKKSIIETIGHEKLKEAYREWYQPERISVVVVGDIDADETEKKIKSTFSGLKNSENNPELLDFDIPKYTAFQYLNVKDPELKESSIKIYQHFKTRNLLAERNFRQYLIEKIYLSILKNRLKEKSLSGSSYDQVICFQDRLTTYDRVFYFSARVKDNQFNLSYEEILLEYERLKRYGVLESEIKEAGLGLLDSSKTSLKEQDTKESEAFASLYINKSLDKSIMLSPKEYNRLCKKYLSSINEDDVNQFLNSIDSNDRVIVCQGNSASLKAFPDRGKIETAMAKTKSMEIGLYSHKMAKAGLPMQVLTKGEIVNTAYYEKTNVTLLELSNGARVVLKPTLFKRDDVVFSAYSPGGLSLLDPKLIPLTELADPIFKYSGLGPLTKLELWTKLKSKKVNASIYVSNHEEGIKGYFSPKNLELFFKLINLGLSNLRFEKSAFEEQKKKYVQKKKNDQQSAFWKLQEKVFQTAWPKSAFNEMITPEAIQNLEFLLSKEALQGRFQNAGDFTFQFVGNFKMYEILPLIKKHIASLPTGKAKEKAKNVNCQPLPGNFSISINENLANKSNVIIQLNHYYMFSVKKAFEFSALETIVNMKINEILREDQGLIYSGKAWNRFFSLKPTIHSSLLIVLTCAPENVDKVVSGVKIILEDLRNAILSEEKIAQIKRIQLNNAKEARQENTWWSHAIKNLVMLDQDLDGLMNYEKYIDDLTPDTFQDHAKKYLDETNMLIAILNPKQGK